MPMDESHCVRAWRPSNAVALVVLCAAVCSALVQAPKPLPMRVTISKTKVFATCYDKTGGRLKGSELVRSPKYVSPDDKYRAYTENESDGFNPTEDSKGEGFVCVSTARLFVAGPGDKTFRLVFLQEPTRDSLLSNLQIIDWSPDSRYLPLNLYISQWGTDLVGENVLLFDAYYGVFWPQDFVDRQWIDHEGRRCSSVITARGFSRKGDLLLTVGPYFSDGESEPDADSCEKQPRLWAFDQTKATFSALPPDYKVLRFGTWAKQ
jgi:hypothetical protein